MASLQSLQFDVGDFVTGSVPFSLCCGFPVTSSILRFLNKFVNLHFSKNLAILAKGPDDLEGKIEKRSG